MPSTKDIVLGKRIMAMFLGPNGFGKTIAAASFHKAGPIKFYDFDGRMEPVKLVYPDADVSYVKYGPDNFGQFQEDYQVECKMRKYATIVIDSLTSLCMTTVTFQMGAKGKDSGKKTSGGIAVPTWDEINGETMLISMLIDFLKMYPGNVIFTCHPIDKTEITPSGSTKIKTIASFGNKIPQIAPNYFNEIYIFDKEPTGKTDKPYQRVIHTSYFNGFTGKSALGLPPKIVIGDDSFYDKLKSLVPGASLGAAG